MSRSTAYDKYPQHTISIDEEPVALRVTIDGEVLAETKRGLALREGKYPAVVYVPREDVRMDILSVSTHSTHCPFKGDASYFDYQGKSRPDGAQGPQRPQVAWSYEAPFDQMEAIRDHLAFYPDRVTLEAGSD